MDLEPRGGPSPAAGGHSTDIGRLPLRSRKLIQAACELCDQWAERTLGACLEHLDKRLYEQAEQSRSHLEQQHYFESRKQLELGRTAFVRLFKAGLRERFEHLGEATNEASKKPGQPSLTLLDWNEHELTAAFDALIARGEGQNLPILSELSYRLAVLIGAAPLEGGHSPLGPQNLARILRAASEPLNLPLEHRVLLLKVFESSISGSLMSLYESVNAMLQANGILPNLRAFTATRVAHGAVYASERARTAAPATGAASTAARGDGEAIAVLETLRDLLARQRLAASGQMPAAAGRHATPDELQIALGALQQHTAEVTDRTSRELHSMQLLQDELLHQLNLGLPSNATRMQLTPEQGDTVELVSQLFEQLVQQLHQGPDAHALLSNLQLPLLRLAFADRDFFNQREHPARKLLGKLADTIDNWLVGPNGELDQALLARLRQLVERTQQEPATAGLYNSLLVDIDQHLTQLLRKAQVAERHHVEAMQGRERMEQARRRADELMAERFAAAPPRGLLRTLLERAWTDVLALTLLRHEEHSEAFLHQLRITDQLLGEFPIDDPLELRKEVETSLQQIGMHEDEAEQVAQRLIGTPARDAVAASPVTEDLAAASIKEPAVNGPEPAVPPPVVPTTAEATSAPPRGAADGSSATGLAIKLKQHQRLGEHHGPETPPAAQVNAAAPLGLREARIHNHLRQLPFGTWFEFTDPATGKASQHKLAWFSPVSGNSLFVNRRGQRSEVMNLQELARAIAEGRVRQLPPQQDDLLDRAWHALTNNLLRPAPPPEARP
ncbi:DUF1631 family protein [Dyella choica]|uniref:DUF1631 family protein n=1 Tax=Dyella choica TaxID=1927959 RepID=A0A432M4G9_9GAMM|nr:DUF1631 family protein [Dyella choica]RUL74435.1 DUF1631 family protein [Dyella choica]